MIYKIPFTGDINSEFSHLILAVLVIVVLSLAWWTTSIRDNWQVRAVYFLDTRLRRSRSRHLRRLTNHTVSSTLVESTQTTTDPPSSQTDPVTEVVDVVNSTAEEAKSEENTVEGRAEGGESSSLEAKDGPAAIIKKMDADNDLVREKRLEFFRRRHEAATDPKEGTSSTNGGECSASERASASNREEIEEIAQTEIIECSVETDSRTNASEDLHNGDIIRVKLKYLNDDLKIVDGLLSELLGEFKRRHFETEISQNKLVKLIFNGQLLQRDDDSLQSYGFFNNCVVHCLIHQQRVTNEDNTDSSSTGSSRNRNGRSNQRDWDLGNLFIILISVFLSSAWYFRYQYPQFFTITA
ncbi:Ubiquitin, partial [Oryctes borbonicus]